MKNSYYSERSGRTPSTISIDHFKKILDIQYRKFEKDGYFQKAFGYNCVDRGYVKGDEEFSLKESLIMHFGDRGNSMVPTSENITNLDIDSLFDLVEFLHDHIAKPIFPAIHDYNNCGIHVQKASYKDGKKQWRNDMNKSLTLLESPHKINVSGNIKQIPSSVGLEHIVDHHTPHGCYKNIDHMVNRACKLFLKRSSTLDDKRDALKNLADVLELLRDNVNEKLSHKDASDIFQIANNFGIRHHNDIQKTQYNRGVYYYWIFYSYLAVIDLLGRLKKNSSE